MIKKVCTVLLILVGMLGKAFDAQADKLSRCTVNVTVNTHKTWDYSGVATKLSVSFKNETDKTIKSVSFEAIDRNGEVISVGGTTVRLKPGEGKAIGIQLQYTQFPKPSMLWEKKWQQEENKFKNLAGCKLIGVIYLQSPVPSQSPPHP